MSHMNRGRSTIHLDADWTIYTDALPKGGVALGTITMREKTGALVQIGEDYLMIGIDGIQKLNARKVGIAIQQARNEADKATGNGSGDSDRG